MNENRKIALAYESMLSERNGFEIGTLSSLKSFSARVKYCREHLECIGRGSSRLVFMLPNGHVLKLAWNNKGIAQNSTEGGDSYISGYNCFARNFTHDPDFNWIESELCRKCTASEFNRLNGFPFQLLCDCIVIIARERGMGKEFPYHVFGDREAAKALLEVQLDDSDSLLYELNDYIGNYHASEAAGDMTRIKNWGIVNRDGKDTTVLVDYGLTQSVIDNYYWGAGRR